MNLNILKPRRAIASAFEKPAPAIALALVFVASIVTLLQPILFGMQVNLIGFVLNLVRSYVQFFIAAVLIYIAALILKGKKNVSGKFAAIISSLGLILIPIIVANLIALAAIPMIFSPLALDLVRDLSSGKTNLEILTIQLNYLIENNIEVINFTAAYAFMAVFLAIGLFNLYLLYLIVSKLFQYRILPNVIVMLVIIVILGLLPI